MFVSNVHAVSIVVERETSEKRFKRQCRSRCQCGRMSDAARSILDHRGCVDLQKILVRFGAPVSEERAGALCYSTVKCFYDLESHEKSNCAIVNSLSHLILHKDGHIHKDTFIVPCGSIVLEGAAAGKNSFKLLIIK